MPDYVNRYGYEDPPGTKLQRHLMGMVSSLQQYSAVYIKHAGEATPAECTHQALLYPNKQWPIVTSSQYERVCIVPLNKMDSSKQQQRLPEDTLLVDTGLLVRTYVSNASAAVRKVPQLPLHAVFYRPAGKCGVVPIMHQNTTAGDAEGVNVSYTVTATNSTTTTTTGTRTTATSKDDDVHNLPTQLVTVKFGSVEFSCNVVVLIAAAVEGCAVLDTHAGGLDWEISNYLQLVRCSN
jgi:hypothetical protein